jgi:hypothetical protein
MAESSQKSDHTSHHRIAANRPAALGRHRNPSQPAFGYSPTHIGIVTEI